MGAIKPSAIRAASPDRQTLEPSSLSLGTTHSTAFAGVISGTGALIKNGGGTLTVSGANTHTGGTTIAGGTLQLGNGGTSGSRNSLGTASPTMVRWPLAAATRLPSPGVISGSGNLAQLGSGTTILTAANSSAAAGRIPTPAADRRRAPGEASPNSAVTVAGGGTA